jgi:CDP-diacylglycerol--glycerol-3-phosphate 3-phosphatidyltransferase
MSGWFFFFYILCGISDMIDGFLARKMNSVTNLGAALDSTADFVFITVVISALITRIKLSEWMLIWLGFIIILKVLTLLTGFRKFHSLAFLHTIMNKITGGLLFCFPVLYTFTGFLPIVFLLFISATFAALEELIINMTSAILNPDVKSFFAIQKHKTKK